MSKVKWNIDAQMVEVWDGEEHFLLHPYLEVEGRWRNIKAIVESKGYVIPTTGQLLAIHNLKRDIDELIVAHFGSMLKESWYWSRALDEDNNVSIVFLHNGFCREDNSTTGTFLSRAVLDLPL